MNLFRRGDRLFEEAGSDPARLDALIAKLQRGRSLGGMIFAVLCIVCAGLAIWPAADFFLWFHSGSSKLTPTMEWMTVHGGVIKAIIPVFLPGFVSMLVAQYSINDQIRILLVVRGMSNSARFMEAPSNAD